MEFQVTSKNLYLKLDVKSTVPEKILCDPKRFKQILFNLIGNAIKFTFKGGITIKVDYNDGKILVRV